VIGRRFTDFLSRLRKGVHDQDRARLAAILELNRALAAARDRNGLLVLLLDEAVQLFGAERGFIILCRDDEKEHHDFEVAVARSLDREPVRSPQQKVSSTVVRRCLDSGEGVFSQDAQEGDLGAASSIADLQLRSVLCMPLLVGERPLGCIYLDHRFQARVFQAEDLPWFQAFADQGAIVLHLHQLLEENRAHAKVVEQRNQDLQAKVASQAAELSQLAQELQRDQLRHDYPDIIGTSPALLKCLHLLDRVVDSDFPILISGESGTGKELVARALHQDGPWAQGPFVPVNVAAISPGLLESELFGHVRGAFTGADRDRVGLLREADSGILFLDEVTEMDPEVQVKLLRFLEDSQVRPVGADRSQPVRLRIVAATNKDPLQEVDRGRFRRDLYYRLAVVTVKMPPLRERLGDIRELVQHFLREAAERARRDQVRQASDGLVAAIVARPWPGNLRQLRNEILRMDALADGDILGPELLSEPPPETAAKELNLERLERWAIQEALKGSGGNKSEAARLLGISRRALYNKLGR
jgi:DNA-binding NtrC family response regulator